MFGKKWYLLMGIGVAVVFGLPEASDGDADKGRVIVEVKVAEVDTNTVVTKRKRLIEKIDELISEPECWGDEDEVRERLDELTATSGELAKQAESGALELMAMNIEMQGLYSRVVMFPDDGSVDETLAKLRATARRAKTVDIDEACGVGDFWLMMAELVEVNRIGLSFDDRQAQVRQLLKYYLLRYSEGEISEAVGEALRQLEMAMGGWGG